MFLRILSSITDFNSQPHEEADWNLKTLSMCQEHFNSQPHEETDHYCTRCMGIIEISTHSLTKRLTDRIHPERRERGNFNSQPHEEADNLCFRVSLKILLISTHSLTKRLTSQSAALDRLKIFQLTASRRG